MEDRAFVEFCRILNPRMKSTALQVPARADKSGICCRWEFKVDRDGDAEDGCSAGTR